MIWLYQFQLYYCYLPQCRKEPAETSSHIKKIQSSVNSITTSSINYILSFNQNPRSQHQLPLSPVSSSMATTTQSKSPQRDVLDSLSSIIALFFILFACVELCDAATVVDVYRLIQYDIAGVPFGSRLASLNHHAGSSLFAPGTDLSRTVVIIPVREMNLTLIRGTCSSRLLVFSIE